MANNSRTFLCRANKLLWLQFTKQFAHNVVTHAANEAARLVLTEEPYGHIKHSVGGETWFHSLWFL